MRPDVVSPISWGIAALLWIVVAMAVRATWHWGIAYDAPLLLYVAKAIAAGATPYRDIFDMNLPGAYLVCMAFVKLFGASDLWWRVFDLAVQGAISIVAYLILKDVDRPLAAIAAAAIALHHLCLGSYLVGQRDFVMVLFEIGAIHCLFSTRAQRAPLAHSALLAVAGASIAFASLIKPTALLMYGVAAGYLLVEERDGRRTLGSLLRCVGGGAAVFAAVGIWLAGAGALEDFFDIQVNFVAATYAGIAAGPWALFGTPSDFAPFAGLLFAWNTRHLRRYAALLAMLVLSLFSYHVQRKYWAYQLAPYYVFAPLAGFYGLALFARSELAAHWPKAAAAAVVGLQIAVLAWGWSKLATDLGPEPAIAEPMRDVEVVETLMADISSLGDLPRGVQPLDTSLGVVNAMLRLGLKLPTRTLYAFPLYLEQRTGFLARERARFLDDMRNSHYPPIVRSNQQWPYGDGYDRLELWPEFGDMLAKQYRLSVERRFADGRGYRVYVPRRE